MTTPLTTTTTPAAAGDASAETAAAPAARRSRFSVGLATTPGRLTLATAVAVLACLLLGVTGFLAGNGQATALQDAQRDAAQLVGAQELRNDLVSADATATNAFLVGGLEPAEARARYESSLSEAAQAGPSLAATARGDGEAADLAAVSDAVQRYAGLVESARANNRQGFPVGAAYLDQASAALRDEVLPTIDEVAVSTSERVDGDMTSVALDQALLLFVLLSLVTLAVVQVWLARRTHRVLNTGLAAASVALLVGGVVVGAAVLGGNGVARSVASGPYAATVATSEALSLATDAKSMESFTLIKRGSGEAFEESYQTSITEARSLLDQAEDATLSEGTDSADAGAPRTLLDEWDEKHAEIRSLDDGGDWDGAVDAATSRADGSAGAAFTAFSDRAHADVEATSADAVGRLGSAATTARVAAWIALVLGLAGAVAAAAGMNVRLKEYR